MEATLQTLEAIYNGATPGKWRLEHGKALSVIWDQNNTSICEGMDNSDACAIAMCHVVFPAMIQLVRTQQKQILVQKKIPGTGN
jgi:hypothetical protein